MKVLIAYLLTFFISASSLLFGQRVQITSLLNSPSAHYANRVLADALKKRAYRLQNSRHAFSLIIALDSSRLPKESFEISVTAKKIRITGGDSRGIIYGCEAVAEALLNGVPLEKIRPTKQSPQYPFRAIKFDLPWDTYRHSYALDQHYNTCRDTAFWRAFLDMMAQNRFNVLTLWNLHPYPYMIKAKNFPEATPFNDAEMNGWHQLFTSIFRMARDRGIDTYLVPFNIFVSPEFAKAHQVAMDNLQHDFFVNADTADIIKRYTRESVTQVLDEYPDLTGFGLTLGEGMGGMTPRAREDWIKEVMIKGMGAARRKSKLIHRIPFSSSTGSLDVTSIATEKLTRQEIEQEGELPFLEKPIWADLKYNWSHAHSSTRLIKVHGGKLYDTYFKPEPTAYRLVWTARNEDFFCLRWGVTSFIREHIAANNKPYTGGYIIGSETYIPAADYFTKITGPKDWKFAFERQWLFYKAWGRLLYNPRTPDHIFKDEFTRRYGKKSAPLFAASALAGKTPLRLASSFDFTWDFSLYSEGFLALNPKTKSVDYISVDRQIAQPPLDTDYISIAAYVRNTGAVKAFGPTKITPPKLAAMLEQDCNKALNLVEHIKAGKSSSLMYELADIKVWANLGLYFASKIRGGMALQNFRLMGKAADQRLAISHLEKALQYWDKVVAITSPIYKEMPLTHLTEQNGTRSKENYWLKFHWKNIRPDVAHDVDIAKRARFGIFP